MTDLAPPLPREGSRVIEGIACIVAGMALFVVQDMLMKDLLRSYPVWVLMCVRGVMAVLILGPLVGVLGPPHRLLSPLWPLHLMRAVLFFTGSTLFYAAFPFMGLAEVSTIFFSAPLMIAVLAALWLRERIGAHRIAALALGFGGVVAAMTPTGDAVQWAAVLPLICAAFYAVSQILARKIGDRETSLTTGLYTVALSGIMILPAGWMVNQVVDFGPEFAHLHWRLPSLGGAELPRLALLGAVGMAGYILLSRAYQIAAASIVAPFDYSYLPMAALAAYFLWGEVPASATLLGMAMIVGSGLYLGCRELRGARARTLPLPVAEAAFAPGNPNTQLAMAADIADAAGPVPPR